MLYRLVDRRHAARRRDLLADSRHLSTRTAPDIGSCLSIRCNRCLSSKVLPQSLQVFGPRINRPIVDDLRDNVGVGLQCSLGPMMIVPGTELSIDAVCDAPICIHALAEQPPRLRAMRFRRVSPIVSGCGSPRLDCHRYSPPLKPTRSPGRASPLPGSLSASSPSGATIPIVFSSSAICSF